MQSCLRSLDGLKPLQRHDSSYFPITPELAIGHLPEQDGHAVYWSQSGAPDGVPLVIAHGGPGGANAPMFRRFADPTKFRIIQIDQRGCGQSTPKGRLEANTLDHTLADMERLRAHLGIDRWVVSGGSWGSTVALAYAREHPEHCLGMMLSCIWLCRPEDVHWWFQGVRAVFPELWEQFAMPFPKHQDDLRTAYCEAILDQNDKEAAQRLYLYEEGFMHFDSPVAPPTPERGQAYGRIFAHYARHDFFLGTQPLLDDASRFRHLPTVLVHGRYDMCCPASGAWELHKVLAHSHLHLVPGAGHYPTEPTMGRAVAEAGSRLLTMLQGA